MRPAARTLALALALAIPASAAAKEHFIDPAHGTKEGDGTAAKPWRTLKEVLEGNLIESQHWTKLPYAPGATLGPKNAGAPVKAGDTLWLLSGNHGDFMVQGYYNASTITVAAASGHRPQISRIQLRSASNWLVRGIEVSPTFAATYSNATMLTVENHAHHGPAYDVTVEDCRLFSVEDTSAWTKDDWNTRSANGINVTGERVTVRGNTLKNVNFGISVSGDKALVEHNLVENFSGDGLRGLGDDGVFQLNTVKNCYAVNTNHDDGFQSWSTDASGAVGKGEVRGVVLRGNVFIGYSDPNQPFRGTLQGIGCFDGFYVDWVIENNVIATDHWHGITLMGARNVRIVNNTVIDLNTTSPGPPWIRIDPHKDGRTSEDILVRNNLVTDLQLTATRLTQDHNLELKDPAAHFVAPPYDLHLLATSTAINAGAADQAPPTDQEGVPRPQGGAVDLGAFEHHVGPIERPDAGPVPGPDAAATLGDASQLSPSDAAAASPADAGNSVTPDGGSAVALDAGGDAPDVRGCSCGASGAPFGLLGLALLGLLRRRTGSRQA